MPADRSLTPPQELLRRKREGQALDPAALHQLVAGIADGRLGDAQVGAFAMAACVHGLDARETLALTLAMRDSGQRLRWHDAGADGAPPDDRPVLDKHSTGGVGDLVSLLLAPMLAACGARVPMLSGRGLGHTGGTLDKLEAIPGLQTDVSMARLQEVVRDTGLAIVGAGPELAPADARLYAIRDITGTVDSIPLITASILAKKLAAGTDALALDIKVGNGAAMRDADQGLALARSLLAVARAAGLGADALLTDMDAPLAPCAGNALELQLALDALRGAPVPARLLEVTLALGSRLLARAGLDASESEARVRLLATLADGRAAERFARMAHALGGPIDLMDRPAAYLAPAPVTRDVPAPHAGVLLGWDTRALGVAVVALGGGRRQPGDAIDPRVGLSAIAGVGATLDAGQPVARVHAASAAEADAAAARVLAALRLGLVVPVQAPVLLGWVDDAAPAATATVRADAA